MRGSSTFLLKITCMAPCSPNPTWLLSFWGTKSLGHCGTWQSWAYTEAKTILVHGLFAVEADANTLGSHPGSLLLPRPARDPVSSVTLSWGSQAQDLRLPGSSRLGDASPQECSQALLPQGVIPLAGKVENNTLFSQYKVTAVFRACC